MQFIINVQFRENSQLQNELNRSIKGLGAVCSRRNNHAFLGIWEKRSFRGGFVLSCLFFREKEHLIKSVGETLKEDRRGLPQWSSS